MTPHQALALGVRLFVIWCGLDMVRELGIFATSGRLLDDSFMVTIVTGTYLLSTAVLLCLWFFPRSIARGLLPHSTDTSTQMLSYQMWFTLGTALLGLWLVASTVTPILRTLSVMYVFKPELINAENLRSLRVELFYYVFELMLGLCLLFGATGIRKLVWRIRHSGPEC